MKRIAFLVSLFLTSCTIEKEPQPEPFLANLNSFERHTVVPNFYYLKTNTEKVPHYDNILIDQPVISLNPHNKYQHINPTYLKYVSDIFKNAVSKSLAKDFTLTKSQGPETLRLRLALTNLTIATRKTTLAAIQNNLIPLSLEDTILEAYFEDTTTGEFIEGIRDKRLGVERQRKGMHGFSTSPFLKSTFEAWGGELRAILSEHVHSKSHKNKK